MKKTSYTFSAKVWLWKGEAPAAWHFMTVPKDVSEKIKVVIFGTVSEGGERTKGVRKNLVRKPKQRGFGAVKVSVTIGKTTWLTSIFPDSRSGCYILPIKLSVRKAEGLYMDGTVKVKLRLI